MMERQVRTSSLRERLGSTGGEGVKAHGLSKARRPLRAAYGEVTR
jgi:hypothetical protein